MMRLWLLLSWCAGLACAQQGSYHWASISTKGGVRAGTMPAAELRSRQLTMSASGAVAAAAPAGAPELVIALRAPESAEPVKLAPGEWSAAGISFGKPHGLTTTFADFTVSFTGEPSPFETVSHRAAIDDVNRAEKLTVKLAPGSLELDGVARQLLIAAAGDAFLAYSVAPAPPALLIAIRRDRDATTMAMRGPYALAEFGARVSFAFAPDAARFFSTSGTLEASIGTAALAQRVQQVDRAVQFQGLAAFMIGPGGGGSFSPRLDQRRRNLALADNGSLFLTAQVGEPGQVTLLHGIGVGIRTLASPEPALARQAIANGNVVSLYGRNLTRPNDGLQVIVGGQPAPVIFAASNQLNVRVAAPPAATLSVEIEQLGRRMAAVPVAIGAAPPAYDAAPAAPLGAIPMETPSFPGDVIDLKISGAPPPPGFTILFDGQPGEVRSSAFQGGLNVVKVAIPKTTAASPRVSVAIATPSTYTDLIEIPVRARPVAPPPVKAEH